jgi:hypothetical protein
MYSFNRKNLYLDEKVILSAKLVSRYVKLTETYEK